MSQEGGPREANLNGTDAKLGPSPSTDIFAAAFTPLRVTLSPPRIVTPSHLVQVQSANHVTAQQVLIDPGVTAQRVLIDPV
jgi:hypothetical protein